MEIAVKLNEYFRRTLLMCKLLGIINAIMISVAEYFAQPLFISILQTERRPVRLTEAARDLCTEVRSCTGRVPAAVH